MNPGKSIQPTTPDFLDVAQPRSQSAWAQEAFAAQVHQDPALLIYWRILMKRKWIVLTSLLVVSTLAIFTTLRMTPLFAGSGQIAIKPESADTLGFGSQEQIGFGDVDYTVTLETQVRILESDVIAAETLKKLRQQGLTMPDHSTLPKDATTDQVAAADASALEAFKSSLSVSTVRNTRLIDLQFLSPDPKFAAAAVNALIDTYIEQNFKTRVESATQTSDWLTRQLGELELKVETSQAALVQYQREAGILGTDEKNNIVTARLDELNRELTLAEADRIQKEAKFRIVREGDADLISKNDISQLLESLRNQEAELRRQQSLMSVQFGPNYPKVQELNEQLAQVRSAIKAELASMAARFEKEYQVALRRETMLRGSLENQKKQANSLNQKAIQYTLLKREADSNRQLYENLLQRQKEAVLASGLKSGNVRIVNQARVPSSPAKPNVPRNIALGIFVGLVGGIAAALVVEGLDNTVRSAEQVEALAGLPALGMIPITEVSGGRHTKQLSSGNGKGADSTALVPSRLVIEHPSSRSGVAEAYRALRTSILLGSVPHPPKVLLVTSPLPGDGKTTTSINTAIVLAQKGSKVLLIDGDLRRPMIDKALNLRNQGGLSTLLSGMGTEQQAIVGCANVPTLSVIPAGPMPPSPTELLGSTVMKEYLAKWRKEYDHIVIDTPPALSVTDSVLLSPEADAVILVVRAGRTNKGALRRARHLLAHVNARVLGVVLNAVDMRSSDYSYHYYGKNKYYGDDASA